MAKKILFDITVSNTPGSAATYETNAREFYSKALLGDERAKRSTRYFRELLTMGEKEKVGLLIPADTLQEADCAFQHTGAALTQKTISPEIYNIGVEVCQWTLEQSFLADYTKNVGAIDFTNTTGLVPEFQSHLLNEISRKTSENLEKLTWQGDKQVTPSDYLELADGLQKILLADTDTLQVIGSTLTTNNIITEIEKVIIQIPAEVDNVKIGMNAKTLRLYKLATAKMNHRENYTRELPANIIDYEIVVMPGMSDDTMVAANFEENFIFATDISRDADLNVIYMKATTGDRKIRVIGDLKFGVDYLISEEIVYYSTDIVAPNPPGGGGTGGN